MRGFRSIFSKRGPVYPIDLSPPEGYAPIETSVPRSLSNLMKLNDFFTAVLQDTAGSQEGEQPPLPTRPGDTLMPRAPPIRVSSSSCWEESGESMYGLYFFSWPNKGLKEVGYLVNVDQRRVSAVEPDSRSICPKVQIANNLWKVAEGDEKCAIKNILPVDERIIT
eukprot:Lankesteria_metandrocarpae@DN2421_c0_g1_i1.p1